MQEQPYEQKPLKQQKPLGQQQKPQTQQGLDIPFDQQIPDLWKKSSLRDRSDPALQPIVPQLYNAKKTRNQQGQLVVNDYVLKQQLGRGAFGQVYKAQNGKNVLAVKVYAVGKLQKNRFFAPDGDFANGLDMLDNQLNIVKRLSHPNIPQFYQILHTPQQIYLVHQFCSMGQIMKWDSLKQNYIRDKKVVAYIQQKYKVTQLSDVTRIIFAQVCQATSYMHHNNITNRDIKVDNILCTICPTPLCQIKVTDFTTIRYSQDDISFFPSGTPGFRGPQHQFATQEGYSSKASDVWSIGISMYTFFYQNFPFYGEYQLEIDIKAKNNSLQFDQGCPQWLKSLIDKMTAKQWKNRINIDQVIHLFMLNN